jgi:8-oxo-dGTP diphosphatase
MVKSSQHIAVAVVRDGNDNILIARRPLNKPQGGKWEFPGGKIQPPESVYQALRREAMEELGIGISSASPLIKVRTSRAGSELILDAWTIDAFRGVASGFEGQEIKWVHSRQLGDYDFPEPNKAILMAIRLPDIYCISPEPESPDEFIKRLINILRSGIKLVQLRSRMLQGDAYQTLARKVIAVCRKHNATVLLNSEPELVLELGADGIHLSSDRLRNLEKRPLGRGYLVAASCHNDTELMHAENIQCDFAVLSPVQATTSHPDTQPLGWQRFEELVSVINMPVYALGGMKPDQVETARLHGAQGVALLSELWRDSY